jgi:N-acetylglucosaminyldiphosphoundecaprenol N-acetyl-beta-D-mannosaminyltransferase
MLTTANFETVRVLGVPLTCCTFDDILLWMDKSIEEVSPRYISITNTESLYHATRVPDHYEYINNSDISCCDGIGVVLAGKILGQSIPRLHGPDLMLRCCEFGLKRKWRHFFYGGKQGVPERLSRRLTQKFPGLITAGTYSPPFRSLTYDEDEEIIVQISAESPHIVWVGLGLLKQEKWIAEHLKKINAPWMIGVGAAFDFHAETVKRAPIIFQSVGLEWLYRLAFEPRMFRRNILSFLLVLKVVKEALTNVTHLTN